MNLNNFNALQETYTKTYENASELIKEAEILFENKCYARAHLLAHIAIEELARCIMVASGAMKYKIRSLDVKKLLKRQTSHESKIEVAYSFVEVLKKYSSPISEEIRKKVTLELITPSIISKERIKELNNLKNSSLYVDYQDNEITTPLETVTHEIAEMSIKNVKILFEFIGLNNWHKGNNLILIAKKIESQILIDIKEKNFGEESKKI